MNSSQQVDIAVLWQSLQKLWISFLSQIPLILIGVLVFGAFVMAARLISPLIVTAGERTRLHTNLGQLFT